MKNKNFLRVLAIVCVLVLCVGVLAACNKGSGGGNQGDGTGGGGETGGGGSTGNQAGASMNAFVNTMFQSANEIANGTSFELADGKNIALSLGATITLKKDGGEDDCKNMAQKRENQGCRRIFCGFGRSTRDQCVG